jgi:hypothetical protein
VLINYAASVSVSCMVVNRGYSLYLFIILPSLLMLIDMSSKSTRLEAKNTIQNYSIPSASSAALRKALLTAPNCPSLS